VLVNAAVHSDEKIARRGYHIYREYGIDPLERHTVSEVMTRDVTTIDANTSIAEALDTHFGHIRRIVRSRS